MATSKQQAHPLRTLIILFAVIAGLFTIMAVNASWAPKLGLDLRGGTTITLTASNTTGTGTVDPKSLELARTIIEQRVNAYGVGEAEVTTSGERQIIVTAPNVQKDDLVKLVGQTAQLNFRKVYAEESTGSFRPPRRRLRRSRPRPPARRRTAGRCRSCPPRCPALARRRRRRTSRRWISC